MGKIVIDHDDYLKMKKELNEYKTKYDSLLSFSKFLKSIKTSPSDDTTQLDKNAKNFYMKLICDKLDITGIYDILNDNVEKYSSEISDLSEENSQLKRNQDKLLDKIKLYKNKIKELEETVDKIETNTKTMIEEFENSKVKALRRDIENNTAKRSISICLTAWNTQDYIEECLDSIEKQTYFANFNDYEILLGIDGCKNTLEKVKTIQHKYRNLRVFMMNENVGTYITTNTLMKIASKEWLLRFDTDDVMLPNMIDSIISYINSRPDIDILRPYAMNFGNRHGCLFDKHGCILMKRSIFDTFGGYKPWVCAADGELQRRLEKFVTIKKYTVVVFNRRVHENNLTIASKTNFNSDIRKKYINLIENTIYKNKKQAMIECKTGKYTEIKQQDAYKIVVSLTSYPERFKYVPSVIESILRNNMKPYKICLCVHKDDMSKLTTEIKELVNNNKIEIIEAEENLRPHCKYYYTMKKYKNHPVITIDDDVVYDIDTIKSLYDSYIKYPHCVSARRVHKIIYENGIATRYGKWLKEFKEIADKPAKCLFATGVGGVLYPPDILKIDEVDIKDIYECILADDILLKWREDRLNVLTVWVKNNRIHGTKIVEAANSEKALFRTNCNKSRNTEYLKIFKLYE